MSNEPFNSFLKDFADERHVSVAIDSRKSFDKMFRILLEKKKIPDYGWSNIAIEQFIMYLSSLDSNNFVHNCGLGEREGRILSDLVAKRNYGFSHGIGRSGDLEDSQPKAVGSTTLNGLTNALCLDLIRTMGILSAKKAILLPMATGMSLTLCLLTFAKHRPNAKLVLWSRIDQKSCFKSILLANLHPIIIDTVPSERGLRSNVNEFKKQIEELGAENIVCIYSTTSCFAPRQSDDITALSALAKKFEIPHLVNNAYGLQSKSLANQIQAAQQHGGRIDLFVQSTDKNLMVPVGGAIVAGFMPQTVKAVAQNYAGRASASATLDVLVTLLTVGKLNYLKMANERAEHFVYLQQSAENLQNKYQLKSIDIKNNPISICIPLTHSPSIDVRTIGAMLFKRNVSGVRAIDCSDTKCIESYVFDRWGSHSCDYKDPYLTAAASLGIRKMDIDKFIVKLDKILHQMLSKGNV